MSITCFKPASGQWYPGFKIHEDQRHKGDYVHVTLHDRLSDGNYRVSVWGADDFGMEYDRKNYNPCYKAYMNICLMSSVSVKALKEMGFVPA